MTTPPKVPMVQQLKASDTIPVSQDGERRRAAVEHIKVFLAEAPEPFRGPKGDPGQSIKGDKGDPGASVKGDKGDPGASIKGDKGEPGTPKRIERYTGTVVGSAGVATVTFLAFATKPLGKVISTWAGTTEVTGQVSDTTTTTATVDVRRSRGTLLLSAGPYEIAPAGTVVTIEVVGN